MAAAPYVSTITGIGDATPVRRCVVGDGLVQVEKERSEVEM